MNCSTMHAIGKWLLASSVAVYLLSSLPSSAHELQRLFLLTTTTATREVPDFSTGGIINLEAAIPGRLMGALDVGRTPFENPPP